MAELTESRMGQGLRVAYLGDLNQYSRARLRFTALGEQGCQVWPILTKPSRPDDTTMVAPRLWERVLFKLGVHLDTIGAGRTLQRLAGSQQMDIVWVDKGLTIHGDALRAVKAATGAKVVSFSEDDMALPHNHSRRWLAALDAYDLVVTTKIANVEHHDLEALGARRVAYVTQAYDPGQHFPVPMDDAERRRFGADLSFVGIFEPERARSLVALAEAGLKARVWGPRWAGKLVHPNLQIEGRWVLNNGGRLEYSKVLTASKIGLGFLRKINRDQHTSRSLEIPACGSLLLAERTPVHQTLFKEGVEAEFFATDGELVEKAKYYLEHEDERLRIAKAGHERCVRDYSSALQMERILKELERI